MRHFLVPTDFSPSADAALGPICSLAAALGARVTLLHVIDSVEYNANHPYPSLAKYRAEVEKRGKEELEARRRKLTGTVDVQTVQRVGSPVQEILTELATDAGYDLLAMPTHGIRGVRRFILGSTTEAALRLSTVDVLVVPCSADAVPLPPRSVLVGTDLSDHALRGVRIAASWAKALGVPLEVAHVFAPVPVVPRLDPMASVPVTEQDVATLRATFAQSIQEQIAKLGDEAGDATGTVIDGVRPSDALAERAAAAAHGLIIAASHGRRGFQALVMGSVAERLARVTDVPVLIVKPEA